jgi:prevent-host-death family protein
MEHIGITAVKRRFSSLIGKAAAGGAFVITKNGRPVATVVPYRDRAPARVGFMRGQISVPDDFDRMGQEAILSMFTSGDE